MNSYRIAGSLLLLLPALASADGPTTRPVRFDGIASTGPDVPLVYRMTVTPALLPVPALKYRFDTPASEQTSGNAAAAYRTAMLLNAQWQWPQPTTAPMTAEDLVGLEPGPFAAAIDDVRRIDASTRSVQQHLRLATSREYCRFDWPARELGIDTMLPELNHARAAVNLLSALTNVALLEGRFDDAAGFMRDELTLARRVGAEGFLVNLLVDLGMRQVMFDAARWWIAVPDSPNLYYALGALPTAFEGMPPILDAERAAALEGVAALDVLLVDAARAEDSARALEKWWARQDSDRPPATARPVRGHDLSDETRRDAAVERVTRRGYPAARLRAFPIRQLLVADERARTDDGYDGVMVASQAIARGELPADASAAFAAINLSRAFEFALRTDRALAAMRTIEAIRAYAAANDGRPPATLADCVTPPAVDNPVDGNPFGYQVTANGFVLNVPATAGETARNGGARYEVTIVVP